MTLGATDYKDFEFSGFDMTTNRSKVMSLSDKTTC